MDLHGTGPRTKGARTKSLCLFRSCDHVLRFRSFEVTREPNRLDFRRVYIHPRLYPRTASIQRSDARTDLLGPPHLSALDRWAVFDLEQVSRKSRPIPSYPIPFVHDQSQSRGAIATHTSLSVTNPRSYPPSIQVQPGKGRHVSKRGLLHTTGTDSPGPEGRARRAHCCVGTGPVPPHYGRP